ncbi:MAG: hypothetical protein SFX73_21190 [Kofleriaceae bacterium]|nr:hypothetical protein [Kofleriaceae bacterium]
MKVLAAAPLVAFALAACSSGSTGRRYVTIGFAPDVANPETIGEQEVLFLGQSISASGVAVTPSHIGQRSDSSEKIAVEVTCSAPSGATCDVVDGVATPRAIGTYTLVARGTSKGAEKEEHRTFNVVAPEKLEVQPCGTAVANEASAWHVWASTFVVAGPHRLELRVPLIIDGVTIPSTPVDLADRPGAHHLETSALGLTAACDLVIEPMATTKAPT